MAHGRFFHLIFNTWPTCINFNRASQWSVIACQFLSYSVNGIRVDNQNLGDSGDSVVCGCEFAGGGSSANSILHVASGGLRLIGNKFNNAGISYLMNLGTIAGSTGTSNLIAVGNSFEGAAGSCIQLQRSATSGTFQNVVITGNQFKTAVAGVSSISTMDTSAFLSQMSITGNVIVNTATSGAGNGVLIDYVNGVTIDSNTLIGSSGASTNGVQIGSHGSNNNIGVNTIKGFGHAITVTAANSTVLHYQVQSATSSVVTGTAFGSALFSGTSTITFGAAFEANTPPTLADVTLIPNNGADGGIAIKATAVSATQLSVQAVGATNGGTVAFQYAVRGILP